MYAELKAQGFGVVQYSKKTCSQPNTTLTSCLIFWYTLPEVFKSEVSQEAVCTTWSE